MIESAFQQILIQIQSEFALIGTTDYLTTEQTYYYQYVNFLLSKYDFTPQGLHNRELNYKNAQTNYLIRGEEFKKLN